MGRDKDLIDPAALEYILKNSVHEPDILARLRKETESHPRVTMQDSRRNRASSSKY